jgi:hypothetical protein
MNLFWWLFLFAILSYHTKSLIILCSPGIRAHDKSKLITVIFVAQLIYLDWVVIEHINKLS